MRDRNTGEKDKRGVSHIIVLTYTDNGWIRVHTCTDGIVVSILISDLIVRAEVFFDFFIPVLMCQIIWGYEIPVTVEG